jgi:hypothetical protein
MITVFFSVHGTVVVNWLPKDCKFNGAYFRERILDPLCETLVGVRMGHSVNRIVHMDNAKSHTAYETENCFQSCGISHVPQSRYSQDISLCDFFLFIYIQDQL